MTETTTPDPAAPVAGTDELVEKAAAALYADSNNFAWGTALSEVALAPWPPVRKEIADWWRAKALLALDAAEIARLRAEVERYQAIVMRASQAIETIGEREAALSAEVAELRAKLQQTQGDTFEEMVKVQDWLDKLVDGWANGRDLNETLLKEVCRYLGKPW